jgi:hypothetical protein
MSTHAAESVRNEHQKLFAAVEQAANEPGRLGRTAREVLGLLQAHFTQEEQYVLPVLELLPKIAWNGVTPAMASVLPIARRLKAELPLLLLQHKDIVAALERMRFQASEAGHQDYERCAAALIRHACEEEDVHYPAAIVVGQFLELKLAATQLA